MSAPVANPTVTAIAAPQAAGGLRPAAAPTGFEALLAALFPVMGPVATTGKTAANPDAPKVEDAEPAVDLTAVQAQLAALLAQVPVGQVPVGQVPMGQVPVGMKPATAPAATAGQAPQTLPTAPKPADVLAALTDKATIPTTTEAKLAAASGAAVPPPVNTALPPPLVQPAMPPKAAPPQVQPPSSPLDPIAAPQAGLKTADPSPAAPIPATPPPEAVKSELPLAQPPAPQVAVAPPAAEAQAAVAAKVSKSAERPATSQAAHVPAQATAPQGSAQAAPNQTVVAALAAQTGGEGEFHDPSDSREGQTSVDDGAPDTAAPPVAGQPSIAHMIQAQAAAVASRGSPETVAKMAAQIIKKLEARSSRFDIALDPVGLGKVDVKVEIGAQGQMTAALSFDSAQAASDLRGRAGELRAALEQAGFDLGSGGLSFSFNGQGGEAGKQTFVEPDRRSANRILQAAAADTPSAAAPRTSFDSRPSGVDVRI
jgi:flagellar hook-length control protein FliK